MDSAALEFSGAGLPHGVIPPSLKPQGIPPSPRNYHERSLVFGDGGAVHLGLYQGYGSGWPEEKQDVECGALLACSEWGGWLCGGQSIAA